MKKKILIIISVLLILIITAAVIFALFFMNKGYRSVKVTKITGDVTVKRGGEKMDAFEDMEFRSEDKVSVKEDSSLQMLVDSDKNILAKENTIFTVNATGNENKGEVKLELIEGDLVVNIENKLSDNSSFKVNTPNASLSVRGTIFEAAYDKESSNSLIYVDRGKVEVKYEDGKQTLEKGEAIVVNDDGLVSYDINGRLSRNANITCVERTGVYEVHTSGDYMYVLDELYDEEDMSHWIKAIDWKTGEIAFELQGSFVIGVSEGDLKYETESGVPYAIYNKFNLSDKPVATCIAVLGEGDDAIMVYISLNGEYESEEALMEAYEEIVNMVF